MSRRARPLTVIIGADLLAGASRRWWVTGAVDELAHLATAAVLVSPLGLDARARRGAYAASVLFDVDHVPEYLFGSLVLSRRTRRPFSHSLATVAVAGVLLPPRSARRGVIVGLLGHLARDLADVDGVPLAWPFTVRRFRVPYGLYSAALALVAFRPPGEP